MLGYTPVSRNDNGIRRVGHGRGAQPDAEPHVCRSLQSDGRVAPGDGRVQCHCELNQAGRRTAGVRRLAILLQAAAAAAATCGCIRGGGGGRGATSCGTPIVRVESHNSRVGDAIQRNGAPCRQSGGTDRDIALRGRCGGPWKRNCGGAYVVPARRHWGAGVTADEAPRVVVEQPGIAGFASRATRLLALGGCLCPRTRRHACVRAAPDKTTSLLLLLLFFAQLALLLTCAITTDIRLSTIWGSAALTKHHQRMHVPVSERHAKSSTYIHQVSKHDSLAREYTINKQT